MPCHFTVNTDLFTRHFLIYSPGSISFSLELYLNCMTQAANEREFMIKPRKCNIKFTTWQILSYTLFSDFLSALRCECKWLYLVAVLKLQSDKRSEKIGTDILLRSNDTQWMGMVGVVFLCGKMWNIEATVLWWMKLYANYVSFIWKKTREKKNRGKWYYSVLFLDWGKKEKIWNYPSCFSQRVREKEK